MIQFRELIRRLQDVELEFVVVGGVAAVLHGVQEPTRDLDICIRPGLQSWERVARVISPIHPRYALTPDKRAFEPSGEELLQFRNLYVLTDLGRIDFLGEVPPLGEIDAVLTQAETYELDGRPVHVIGLEQLLRVKEHVRRPKDLEVAVQLRALIDLRKRRP